MFDKKFNAYVKKIEPKQVKGAKKGDDPKTLLFVTLWVTTEDMEFFDDMNFAGKEKGLGHILSGALPITGAAVELSFVDPDVMEMDLGETEEIAVKFNHVKTGALDEYGKIAAEVQIAVLEFTGEEAGDLIGYIGSVQECRLVRIQAELPLEK